MFVIDLNGKQIEVTDIHKAIEQADDFRHSRHCNDEYSALDKELQQYWNDLYQKLMNLEANKHK